MKRKRLIGAMCPTCRTVQDWSGEHIYAARVMCNGGHTGVGRHLVVAVRPVSGVVSR